MQGGPAGAPGYVGTITGDALGLDPIPWRGGEAAAESALVVFVLDGLCLALPCDRVGPGDAAAAVLLCARLADPAQRAARDAAPRARQSQAEAVLMRQTLIAMAGGMRLPCLRGRSSPYCHRSTRRRHRRAHRPWCAAYASIAAMSCPW